MKTKLLIFIGALIGFSAFSQGAFLFWRKKDSGTVPCSTSLLTDGSDTLLEGWEGDGTEQTWTEAGTAGRLTFGGDSSALTSGKVTGLCDKALRFDNSAGSGAENWARWDNGGDIDCNSVTVNVTFYIYIVTPMDDAENFNIFSANPTTTISTTDVGGIRLSRTTGVSTISARGAASSTEQSLVDGQWNKVELHFDTTAASSTITVNGGTPATFTRGATGIMRYFNVGALSTLDAADVCEFWIDGVQVNTP